MTTTLIAWALVALVLVVIVLVGGTVAGLKQEVSALNALVGALIDQRTQLVAQLGQSLALLTARCNLIDALVADKPQALAGIEQEINDLRFEVEGLKGEAESQTVRVMHAEIDFLRRVAFEDRRFDRAAADPNAAAQAVRGGAPRAPEEQINVDRSRPGPLRPIREERDARVPYRPGPRPGLVDIHPDEGEPGRPVALDGPGRMPWAPIDLGGYAHGVATDSTEPPTTTQADGSGE